MVGDAPLIITQHVCGGAWKITGWRRTPDMYVQGVASDSQTAQLELSVIRTIRFIGAVTQAAVPSDTPSVPTQNRALLALIDTFFAHPLRTALHKDITDSAIASPNVTVTLGPNVEPWLCYSDTGTVIKALDGVLTVAFMAGDMRDQLVSGHRGDQPGAGMWGALLVYQAIRSRIPDYQVPELDGWKVRADAGQLKAVADSIAGLPSSHCPQTPQRHRAAVNLPN